jgi:hypothetical protein
MVEMLEVTKVSIAGDVFGGVKIVSYRTLRSSTPSPASWRI